MKITIANVVTIENPTVFLIDWIKNNLVIPNPEYERKMRMGFWIGDTPKQISLYERNGAKYILPFGSLTLIPSELLLEAEIVDAFKAPVEIDYGGDDVPLYDYQQKAVEGLMDKHFGILQSAAGSGKTQMGIALAKNFKRRTLWLTHTSDLLKQSMARAEKYMDKSLIGTITEGKVNIGKGITFATIQTMSKLYLNQYKDIWDVIIVDECHRVAGTPTAMTQFYKVLNALSARHKYGLSATVHRSDGMIGATYALLGSVVYEVPKEAVADKIMQVGIYPVTTGVPISYNCLNTDGTLNYAKLITYLAGCEIRNYLIVDYLKADKDKPSLILSDRLSHLEELIDLLPEDMKEDAVMISGKMVSKKAKAEREKFIQEMREGKKKYLFASYSLAKEGLDIPRLERLYLTTPQKDYAVVTQSIGRIARTFEGKADPIAYDFVDSSSYLIKSYKKRCTIYRKNNCYFVEEQ